MNEQDKKLLLTDLCARLPHDTIVSVVSVCNGELREDVILTPFHLAAINIWVIKPYLRPMSSMTEEEIKEWDIICVMMRNMPIESISMVLKFVNSKHLDYNNLIPKGLALPAPEGMYQNDNNENTVNIYTNN